MIRIDREIQSCMQELVVDGEQSLSAYYSFPRTFAGFQGHFPGNPLVPGVCLIQAVAGMLETAYQEPLRIKMVKNVKFTSPVVPDEMILIKAKVAIEGDRILRAMAAIEGYADAGRKIAKLQLMFHRGAIK